MHKRVHRLAKRWTAKIIRFNQRKYGVRVYKADSLVRPFLMTSDRHEHLDTRTG